MEKIRSSITNARAYQDAALTTCDTAAPPKPAYVAGRPAEARGVRTAISNTIKASWAALPGATFDAERMRRHRIVALERGSASVGIDMMRTRILQQIRDNGWRRLAITSPTAGCGKSTIALNLAVSLSRQSDLRSLLLELDLRRPALAQMLGVNPRPMDLSDVLRGKAGFAEAALRYGGNTAVALTNTKIHDDAAELLGSTRIGGILSGIEVAYAPDIVIFDMPPMLAAADMMAFAPRVDCVLIIAAAERTTAREIDLCEQELARQTNVMGVVLNACRHMGPKANYGYDG